MQRGLPGASRRSHRRRRNGCAPPRSARRCENLATDCNLEKPSRLRWHDLGAESGHRPGFSLTCSIGLRKQVGRRRPPRLRAAGWGAISERAAFWRRPLPRRSIGIAIISNLEMGFKIMAAPHPGALCVRIADAARSPSARRRRQGIAALQSHPHR